MAEPRRSEAEVLLQVKGLNVYYGRSHALQGVDLTLDRGVLSVVGRNGMGKTTLCKTIMGLVARVGGSIRMRGEDSLGLAPAQIARLGVGYVPQGRRLWRSLTVDEHLRMTAGSRRGAWTVERVYDAFPRLAERRGNGGGQLSGGEQQMLAISRALVTNPRSSSWTSRPRVSRPSSSRRSRRCWSASARRATWRSSSSSRISASPRPFPRASRSWSTGGSTASSSRAGSPPIANCSSGCSASAAIPTPSRSARSRPRRICASPASAARSSRPDQDLCLQPGAADALVAAGRRSRESNRARASLRSARSGSKKPRERPLGVAPSGPPVVIVVGTLDTKGEELRFMRDLIVASGLRTRLVDVSTSGKLATCDVTAQEIALNHGRGGAAVFGRERGASVAAMAEAFEGLDQASRATSPASRRRRFGRRLDRRAGHARAADRRAQGADILHRLGRRRPLCRPDRHHDDVFGHRRSGPELDLAPGARQRRAGADRHGEGPPETRGDRRARSPQLPLQRSG
jgi:ABC-type transport system involved in cytochrome c biogenesis ATPase subunit